MMRKISVIFALILVLAGGVFSPAVFSSVAYAQQPTPINLNEQENQQNSQQAQNEAELKCGSNLVCAIIKSTGVILTFPPVLVATISGMIFDFSVWYSIQGTTYSAYDGTVGDEGFVVKGWKLVRDFANLIFIFALFFVAFVLILGLDNGQQGPLGLDPKKTVARVIIMALLVNFSFFFGRTVIEITNIFANSFYNNITMAPGMSGAENIRQGATEDVNSFYENFLGIRSISSAILSFANTQQLMLSSGIDLGGSGWIWKSHDISTYGTFIFVSFISFVFHLLLVYIFLSIALLFIGRTIGLFLYIIIAPIAFVSYTVPFLQKQNYFGFDDWMKQFFGMAFMAPIFMFFLYIAIQFFQINFGQNPGFLSSITQITFKLIIISFLLVFAKKITGDLAGKVGGAIAGAVTSVVTTTAMVGAAVATGGASAGLAVGRQAVTRAAVGAGEQVLGAERTQAVQQRLASTNFRSLGTTFKDIPNQVRGGATSFAKNPLQTGLQGLQSGASLMGNTTLNLARASGSQYADTLERALGQGKQVGNLVNKKGLTDANKILDRRASMDQAGRVRKEKIEKLDNQINDVRTKMTGTPSPADRSKLAKQLSDLKKERDELTKPLPSSAGKPAPKNQPVSQTTQQNQQSTAPRSQPQITRGQNRSGGAEPQQNLNVGTLKVNKLVVNDQTSGKTNEVKSEPRKFGDGKEPKPEYTAVQQERILRKAIAAEEKKNQPIKPSLAPTGRAVSLLGSIQQISQDKPIIPTSSLVPETTGFKANEESDTDFDFGGIQLPSQNDQE